ncbi:MAG: hypothetical protein JJ978_09595 [Roseivirga sp.]|jgi:hypothetical protein|uniref:hypothetical protein n=1 Tax=Roseivirga sp. TaxID=1964215 RepID=UPI001B0AB082|nr:hypothetical protein [Roseivirga sp.]MBO6495809.1 hypothetical protein [Roseivirga sp.]
MLFPYRNRTDLDPAYHNENTYAYYNRSARNDVSIVRQKIEEWFSNYPQHEQEELKSRFKKTFSSAFYELFLFQLFSQLGFEIEIHPEIPNSSKRPDFLIKKGKDEFYIEAKETKDKSEKEIALDNRVNQVYDSLNRVKTPNFLLKIDELVLKTDKQPATKNIVRKIEEVASKLDPDELTKELELNGLEGKSTFSHNDDDINLNVSFIPKLPKFRNSTNSRAIGMYPFTSFWGGSEDSIKTSFKKKANRYGLLDKPYIICINAIGIIGNGEFDINNALWGSLAFTYSTNPEDRDERVERKRDGIFLTEKGPRYQNVSGVLVTKVMEFNIADTEYYLAKHPYSNVESNFDAFDLTYYFNDGGSIVTKKGKSFGEILKVDKTWLEG